MGRIMADHAEIVRMVDQGMKVKQVADLHHLRYSSVYRIYRRATGKRVAEQHHTSALPIETHPIYHWRTEIGLGGKVVMLNDGIGLLVIQP